MQNGCLDCELAGPLRNPRVGSIRKGICSRCVHVVRSCVRLTGVAPIPPRKVKRRLPLSQTNSLMLRSFTTRTLRPSHARQSHGTLTVSLSHPEFPHTTRFFRSLKMQVSPSSVKLNLRGDYKKIRLMRDGHGCA